MLHLLEDMWQRMNGVAIDMNAMTNEGVNRCDMVKDQSISKSPDSELCRLTVDSYAKCRGNIKYRRTIITNCEQVELR